MKLRDIAYIALILFLPSPTWGQSVSIQARIDRAEIRTGEQAAIDVTIRTDNLPKTRFYLAEDPQAGEPFVVLEFVPLDTIAIDSKVREIRARMLLTSFDSTLVTIPPIIVETPTGRSATEPMALNVIQPDVDVSHPEQFKAIKKPWTIELRLRDFIEVIMTESSFWIVLLFVTVGYAWYRHRKEKHSLTRASIPIHVSQLSPYQIACDTLSSMQYDQLEDTEHYKIFYTKLVSTLKAYMDARRGWQTAEMTTTEVMTLLKEELSLHEVLKSLLDEADMIKFARHSSSKDTALYMLNRAKKFISDAELCWNKPVQKEEKTSAN